LELAIRYGRTAEFLPCLSLGQLPAVLSRFFRILAGNVDLYAVNFDVGAGGDRRNAAVSQHLRDDERTTQRKRQRPCQEVRKAVGARSFREWKTGHRGNRPPFA